jgi:gamma-glutamyltranspeptidase
VADRAGGLVATTTTLNFAYGNGISVPGAGLLLINNEIDDFALQPGATNAYGLVEGQVNAVAPARRPLSSMTPTLVFRSDGRPWLATGSPGGGANHHNCAPGAAGPDRASPQPGQRGGRSAHSQPALARSAAVGAGLQP